MSGLASGAERVYLNEEGVKLGDLEADLKQMIEGFQQGKRLSLVIRNEKANPLYTTSFMSALFEEEGQDLFDVRSAILGHMQQGGNPSPFDRIQATRLATRCVEFLSERSRKELHQRRIYRHPGRGDQDPQPGRYAAHDRRRPPAPEGAVVAGSATAGEAAVVIGPNVWGRICDFFQNHAGPTAPHRCPAPPEWV